MRYLSILLLSGLSLLLSSAPSAAQLAAPNDAGISVGHVHLVVADPDAQKKLWVDLLGGQLTDLPPLQLVRFPGILVVLQKAQTPPAEGSDGSTVNHFGFLVKSYADIKAKLTALHLEFAMDNANNKQVIAIFPEKIRVEFTEDPNLATPIAFHHFHVAATDQAGLRDWYVKTFGATAGGGGPNLPFVSANLPGVVLNFSPVMPAPAPTAGRAYDHIGFEVKNLSELLAKLDAQGIKPTQALRHNDVLNINLAFVTDPWGTTIELTEGLSKLP